MANKNLTIYYSSNTKEMDVWCSKWVEDNWDVSLDCIMTSGQRNTIFDGVTPGAFSELYNILGTPKIIDSTYSSGNTLKIKPVATSNLNDIRNERTVAVKSISDEVFGRNKYIVKFELKRIDI